MKRYRLSLTVFEQRVGTYQGENCGARCTKDLFYVANLAISGQKGDKCLEDSYFSWGCKLSVTLKPQVEMKRRIH